jgi:hypothetical protein
MRDTTTAVASTQRAINHHIDNYAKNPKAHGIALRKLGVPAKVVQHAHKQLAPLGPQAFLKRDFAVRPQRVKQIESGPYHELRDILDVTTGIPSAIEMFKHRPKDRNIEHMANVKSALPMVAGFGFGGPHFGKGVEPPRKAQSEAAQKVTGGLKKAQTLRRQQKELRHEELVKRVGAAEEAMKKTPGDEGLKAAKHELRGALPKLEFNGARGLTREEHHSLQVHIQNHPKLQLFDKITAGDALRNAWHEGILPTKSEQKLLVKAFGPEYEKELFRPTGLQRAKHVAIETANIPRAVMASADVSGPGRQGIVAMSRHPVITGRNLKPMLKSFGSEKYYHGRRVGVEENPFYEEAKEHGLAITDMEHTLGAREEPFQSNYAERIPVAGHVVRSSGRAYTDFLVNSRLDIYSHLRQLAEKQGYDLDRKALKDLTGYINSATGRGNLGQFEKSAVGLNSWLFSPRLIASRLDFLLPWKYAGLDPFVRKQKMRAAVQFAGMLTTALYLADQVPGVDVGIDPRSTDFGKMRIGDTRVDFTGGFSQYVRLAAQMATRQRINPATGKPEKGKSWDTLARFARAKLSPTASAGADVATGTQYSGQPLKWKSEIGSRAFPLGFQDAYSIYHNTGSIPGAAAGYGASAVGFGVQNYKPTPHQAPKLDLKTDLTQQVQKYYHHGLTPQIKEALRLRETRTKYLDKAKKEAKDSGKTFGPLERFNAQVDLLRKTGRISAGQAQYAKAWAARQPGAVGEHKITSESKRIADKWFGGSVLTDAGRKLRARGSQFYLAGR